MVGIARYLPRGLGGRKLAKLAGSIKRKNKMATTQYHPHLASQTMVLQPNITLAQATPAKPPFNRGLSKSSPFMLAWQGVRDDGKYDRLGYGNFDLIRPYFLRSKGTRANLPSSVALALLMGMRGKIMRGQVTGTAATDNLLRGLKLTHYIPCIPGIKKGYSKTSKAGHDLLLLWVENDPKFKKFYDVFVDQSDIDRCVTWATMIGMGLPIPEIEEIEKKAEEHHNKIVAMQAQQLQLQQQYYSVMMNAKSINQAKGDPFTGLFS